MRNDGIVSLAPIGNSSSRQGGVARPAPVSVMAVAGCAAIIVAIVVVAVSATSLAVPGMGMANPWLPPKLRVAAVLVYVAVVVAHVWHLRDRSARRCLWHVAHVMMALGMIEMFAVVRQPLVGAEVGKLLFAVGAAAILAYVAAVSGRGKRLGWLWVAAAADMASMAYMFAYMFAMPSGWFKWLTWPLVAWATLQATGWLTGALPCRADLGSPAGSVAARHSGADLSISVTLAAMNVGMAYMLVAMALGMPTMPAMGDMHGI
ncbi:DUF5134 domain-containing protein [Mycobacterium sp.]|uniref:DUF5134 domain-containing protein n=1 Tax=Mycobacterium sp. TaxID=1785 RepID=UPI0026294017|nr:DUF5134 domain-containing protein [Mycobacterium sp.]